MRVSALAFTGLNDEGRASPKGWNLWRFVGGAPARVFCILLQWYLVAVSPSFGKQGKVKERWQVKLGMSVGESGIVRAEVPRHR